MRHFDKYMCVGGVGGGGVSVLRVYDPDRRTSTVNDDEHVCVCSCDVELLMST